MGDEDDRAAGEERTLESVLVEVLGSMRVDWQKEDKV